MAIAVAIVAVAAAAVQTGVSIYQANEQQEAQEKTNDMQEKAQHKAEVRQVISQTAQRHREQEQAAQIRMAAGSAAKINDFMAERARTKASRQLEVLAKNDGARTERYMGRPDRTLNS